MEKLKIKDLLSKPYTFRSSNNEYEDGMILIKDLLSKLIENEIPVKLNRYVVSLVYPFSNKKEYDEILENYNLEYYLETTYDPYPIKAVYNFDLAHNLIFIKSQSSIKLIHTKEKNGKKIYSLSNETYNIFTINYLRYNRKDDIFLKKLNELNLDYLSKTVYNKSLRSEYITLSMFLNEENISIIAEALKYDWENNMTRRNFYFDIITSNKKVSN